MDKELNVYERTPVIVKHKVYKRRWFILFTVVALNVCFAQIWCSYASVSNIAAEYYGVSVSEISLFTFVYFVCCFPGIFALWFTDYVGLNKAVWIGAWLLAIGATLRAITAFSFIEGHAKYKVTLGGQIISGLAPSFLNLPTKVSELWFPPNERAIATCLVAIASPIGVMLGIGLEPVLVTEPEHIPLVNLFSCAFALFSAILTFGFTSAKPPTPPSESAGSKQPTFHAAFKEMMTNKPYLLLLLFEGAANAVNGVIVSLLEEMLHPWGYSNKFAGLCVVLMVLFGIVGGGFSGVLLNKTKAFIPIAKTCRGIGCILLPLFAVLTGYPGMEYPLAVFSAILGIIGLLGHTSVLELTIECTYPFIPEALSTGVLRVVSEIFSIIYFLMMIMFATEVHTNAGVGLDMRISVLIVAGIVVGFGIAFILCFHTEYRRERRETQSQINLISEIVLSQEDITSTKKMTYGTIVSL